MKQFAVLDEGGYIQHAASHPSMCHEHINDLINGYGFDASRWVVREVLVGESAQVKLERDSLHNLLGELISELENTGTLHQGSVNRARQLFSAVNNTRTSDE